MKIKIIFISLAFFMANEIFASDIEREKRMAAEIADSIIDGEAVYLKSGEHEFLNIYMETDVDEPAGAVIILHGRGYHPNWQEVVYPLRTGLTEAGWNTLSMQMPVLGKQAKYYDYVPILDEAFPRIEAGIKYLKQRGNKKIILIAHSCSVHMVMAWVNAGRFKDIDAYVGIGSGATDYKQYMAEPFPFEEIKVPVLDIYGSEEYPAVLLSADERMRLIRKGGNIKSAQVSVPGANHYFTDRGEALLQVVSDWLQKL